MLDSWIITVVVSLLSQVPQPAFEGAEGFGATSLGGRDGQVLQVTTLDDDADNPPPGSLRWAVEQEGPRIVRFAVSGNIRLKAPLTIRHPRITIDGSTAPGLGICLCDHSLEIDNTHDVIVRYLRIRRGDVTTLERNARERLKRPRGSRDLDCVSIDDSSDVLFDHVSASWSCDEVFGIVRSRNVTLQWCILSEPLSNPALHPYGDNHAFGLNTSASTLSVHHCLFAHYVMRGPQFEANDVDEKLGFEPRMEAVNNVLFDYQRSGSRYTTGIENHPERAGGVNYAFHFIGNTYVGSPDAREIEATTRHGVIDRLGAYVAGNVGPHGLDPDGDPLRLVFADRDPISRAAANVRAQIASQPLFAPPIAVTAQSASEAYEAVLTEAGCSHRRDAVDQRIIENVRQRRFGHILHSQSQVGGWPALD